MLVSDKVAVGDPPQELKTSTLQTTSEKYLFMAPLLENRAPGRTTREMWEATTLELRQLYPQDTRCQGNSPLGRLVSLEPWSAYFAITRIGEQTAQAWANA